jgi:hypothetical protein
VKFFCFYGRIPITYEVKRLHHDKKINWYDIDGNLIRTGQYEDIEFESEGLRPEEVELAAKISTEIPTPFLRIDFMRAENDDLVFCEFTPCPENFEKFNAHVDLVMGREFASAEARLKDDLLMGSRFLVSSRSIPQARQRLRGVSSEALDGGTRLMTEEQSSEDASLEFGTRDGWERHGGA